MTALAASSYVFQDMIEGPLRGGGSRQGMGELTHEADSSAHGASGGDQVIDLRVVDRGRWGCEVSGAIDASDDSNNSAFVAVGEIAPCVRE